MACPECGSDDYIRGECPDCRFKLWDDWDDIDDDND